MANYFNNEAITELIIEYLAYPLEDRTVEKRALFLREQILKEVSKIINGIIFTHKFTVWEHYDDLFQEAAMACLKALDKFNPNYITSTGDKATAFNYFSLTAKRCLKFYTIRNKKNRDNLGIEDHSSNLIVDDDTDRKNTEAFIENLVQETRIIFQKKHKKFNPLVDILDEYLHTMGSFNKRDFFRYSKSFGWSPNLIRKFLKIIKDNKDELMDHIDSDLKE
jgi:hypothetical protein